ncbi:MULTISPECIES: transcriptional regulator [Klebsiella pneumoniae complex]|uniref:transcriptional regulator n=1 Tax=Klebsiella pneumoniae complex TaxID=3390273 RepID=UPI00101B9A88|nr:MULTISPECIES: helix-turn-helix domain-containing protein [Klebsiella]EKW2090165.1 helix-turn-helix domain-containing protein [Klebsiella variicola]MDG0556551.1 helix-turn-helix domain-containing protein [Klebsiella quasipneumoniae]MEB5816677.1 helix-turn-helix domain-containing protein [Klebsiella quasipneumoniae]
MVNKAIEKAINALGNQQKLAEAVGVKQPSVWRWLHNKKRVSPENVVAIVTATNGLVKAHEIRPDLPQLFPPEMAA